METLIQKINNMENRLLECEANLQIYRELFKSITEIPKTKNELNNQTDLKPFHTHFIIVHCLLFWLRALGKRVFKHSHIPKTNA